MEAAFTKMHGLGNDFVIFDARIRAIALSAEQARRIADRRLGVGCDQVIVIEPARNGASAAMRILNADGGEVEACGNAARCVAALLFAEGASGALRIDTPAGEISAWAADRAIAVDMGPARLGWREIPVARECDTLHLPVAFGGLRDPVGVNIGNPHAVFFVADVSTIALETAGPALEHDSFFPERANIEIAQITGPASIRMRVWERGVGITRACGTGACATLVAAVRRGLIAGRQARLTLDGGELDIAWRTDNHVIMTGPAALAFRGTLELA